MTDKPLKLSAAGRAMLTLAALRDDGLVPPPILPIAAARSVVRSLISAGLIEEVPAPSDETGLLWRETEDGQQLALRATATGLVAIGADAVTSEEATGSPTDVSANSQDGVEPQGVSSSALITEAALDAPEARERATQRVTLRRSVQALLEAWDDVANNRAGVPDAIEQLRRMLTRPERITATTRRPRENTKQAQVLAMLRRPEGATVAQIAEAMNWAPHTVRGFFVGMQKRLGTTVVASERVRQVGSGKEGAKGSYTVYRITETG